MTLEAIKAAIAQLAEADRRTLANWFEQLEKQPWDVGREAGPSDTARERQLAEKLNQEIGGGRFTPIEDGPRSVQKKDRTPDTTPPTNS